MFDIHAGPETRDVSLSIEPICDDAIVAPEMGGNDDSVLIQRLEWACRAVPNARCGRHRTGYVATWPGQPLLKCESELERRVLHALVSNRACVGLATQPLTVWYRWGGKNYRYTPDILGIFAPPGGATSSVRLFEVKPLARLAAFRARLSRHSIALEKAVVMPLTVLTETPAGGIVEVLS